MNLPVVFHNRRFSLFLSLSLSLYFYRATYNKDLSSELCNIVPCEKIIKTASRKVSFRKFCAVHPESFLIYVCLLLIIMECKHQVNTKLAASWQACSKAPAKILYKINTFRFYAQVQSAIVLSLHKSDIADINSVYIKLRSIRNAIRDVDVGEKFAF